MNIEISPSSLSGDFYAPPSKSYGHRLAILSCLMGKKTTVKNIGSSQDILTTLNCLKTMGADFQVKDNDLEVLSFTKNNNIALNCDESGSTLRFLLPICCALNIKAKITGSKSLLSRPNVELIKTLNNHGANIVCDNECFIINGNISCGEYEIDSSVSSQYASGLLLSLSLLKGKSKIIIKNGFVSESYVHITIDCLKHFGIIVNRVNNAFYIDSNNITIPTSTFVEGDFSSSAFLLSAGAIANKVFAKNLNQNSFQGDSKILTILKSFGSNVSFINDSACVSHNQLNGITIDCADIPDLVPIIAVVSAFAKGKTILKNIERLRYKESDRVKGIMDMLIFAGIRVEYSNGCLLIFGGKVKGANFNSNNDHRLAMAQCVLSCFADGNSTISNVTCVDKSYPNFIQDFVLLGGKING